MRLLWLLRYPPFPPNKGGDAVYSRSLVEHVGQRATVDALSFAAPGVVPVAAAGVEWHAVPRVGRSRVLGLVSPLPDIAYRHLQPAYTEAMLRLARGADAVFVDHVGLLWAVEVLKRSLGADCPPVIAVNHDHEGSMRADMVRGVPNPVLRAALSWDGLKAGRLERRANRAADGLTAITTTDLDAFAADAPGVPGLLVMPGYDGPVVRARRIDADTPMRLCILGGRGALHKQVVLRLILEAIVAAGLQRRVTVDVVGGTAEAGRYPGVNFLGYVEDLAGYMQGVRVGLIPDEVGGGFKLRALSHAFLRVPMLALSKAMQGMTLRQDIDYVGVGSIAEMVARAPALMAELERLNAVQDSAFAHCDGRFAWSDRAGEVLRFATGLRRAGG